MKFSELPIVPFGVRADRVPHLFDSEMVYTLMVKAKWITPVTQGNRQTLYDYDDLRAAWQKLKSEGIDALKEAARAASAGG